MLNRTRNIIWTVTLAVVAMLAVVFAPEASAAPVVNHFAAYDFRYETSYSCYGQTCWYVPYSTGFTSTFNAPGLRSTWIRDSIGGPVNSDRFTVAANQNVGVMCWKADSAGSIWLLADSRQSINDVGGTALFVGWVLDADILLSRADRLQYVTECGYLQA